MVLADTALSCDLVGSASLTEDMDPEDWAEIIARALRMISDAAATLRRASNLLDELGIATAP